MCAHEWSAQEESGTEAVDESVRDAVGNELNDGDTVTVMKSVKIAGGGGGTIKAGTKVRGIRLIEDSGDGHDLEARVPELGRMKLKSSIVKKS